MRSCPCLVDADGFVAPGLAGLAVGGQKQPRGIPAVPPLLSVISAASRWLRVRHKRFPPTVIDGRPARQASSAAASRSRSTASRRVLLNSSAACDSHGAAATAPPPAGRRRPVPPRRAAARTAASSTSHPGAQIGTWAANRACPAVLVLHRTGERTGPPRRRHRRDRTLTLRTPRGMSRHDPNGPIEPAQPAHRDTPTPAEPPIAVNAVAWPRCLTYPGPNPHPSRRGPPPPDHRSDAAPLVHPYLDPGSHHRQPRPATQQRDSLPCGITQFRSASGEQMPTRAHRRLPCRSRTGVGGNVPTRSPERLAQRGALQFEQALTRLPVRQQ